MIDQDAGIYVSALLLLLIAVFNIFYFFKKFDIVFVFVNVHLSSLALYFTYQSGLLSPMHWWELALLLSYLLGFIFGFAMHYMVFAKNSTEFSFPRDGTSMFFINVVGFAFFLAAFLYELAKAGWIPPLLAADKLTAYYNFPQTFFHYLVVCGIAISTVFVFIAERYGCRRSLCYTFVAIIALAQMATLARAVLMTQLFMAVFIIVRERNILFRWKKLILAVVSGLTIITIFGTMRTSSDANALFEIGLLNDWPSWSLPFAWIYLYFTTPLENVHSVFNYYDQGFGYGLHTFVKPFFNLVQAKDYYASLFELQPPSAGGFNTYGYYLEVFMDYGYFGFLYTFLLGFVSRQIVVGRSLVLYLFSSYWVYAIFTSSINMYFNEFFTLVYLAYFALVVFFSRFTVFRRL
ncbi:O-antigen polymerase [Pseudomonas pergaminensis]